MKKDLYRKCMDASFAVSAALDYAENGTSQLVDSMIEGGFDEDDAVYMLFLFAGSKTEMVQAYFDCFEEFGVMDEFDEFSSRFSEITSSITRTIEEFVHFVDSQQGDDDDDDLDDEDVVLDMTLN